MNEEERRKVIMDGIAPSAPSVIAVYEFLKRHNCNVRIEAPLEYVEDFYGDDGDIVIVLSGVEKRVETKQNRGYDWHSFEQWHTRNIYIDSREHIYEKVYPYPLCAYALVNQSNTGMFFVPAFYKEHWYIVPDKWNKLIEKYMDYVAMDREYLQGLYFDFDGDAPIRHLIR